MRIELVQSVVQSVINISAELRIKNHLSQFEYEFGIIVIKDMHYLKIISILYKYLLFINTCNEQSKSILSIERKEHAHNH